MPSTHTGTVQGDKTRSAFRCSQKCKLLQMSKILQGIYNWLLRSRRRRDRTRQTNIASYIDPQRLSIALFKQAQLCRYSMYLKRASCCKSAIKVANQFESIFSFLNEIPTEAAAGHPNSMCISSKNRQEIHQNCSAEFVC